MMVCGVCKGSKSPKVKWVVKEHSSDNSILRDFKMCDDCAVKVIRKMLTELDPETDHKSPIILNRSGIMGGLSLTPDDDLEVTLLMDLAKARKAVLEETGTR